MECSREILIVEDDIDLREALGRLLVRDGYNVSCAAHGGAALEYLRSGLARPCVILLDLMMPIMDGRAFRQEQMQDPALCKIPVVLVTAGGRSAAAGIPAADILLKPVGFDVVARTVERFCTPPCS
jgi:CheY-like chemotaxis protein